MFHKPPKEERFVERIIVDRIIMGMIAAIPPFGVIHIVSSGAERNINIFMPVLGFIAAFTS